MMGDFGERNPSCDSRKSAGSSLRAVRSPDAPKMTIVASAGSPVPGASDCGRFDSAIIPPERFELPTGRLEICCSIHLSYGGAASSGITVQVARGRLCGAVEVSSAVHGGSSQPGRDRRGGCVLFQNQSYPECFPAFR